MKLKEYIEKIINQSPDWVKEIAFEVTVLPSESGIIVSDGATNKLKFTIVKSQPGSG